MKIFQPEFRKPRPWIVLAAVVIAGATAGLITGLRLLPTEAHPGDGQAAAEECAADREYLFLGPKGLRSLVLRADVIVKGEILSRTPVTDTYPARGVARARTPYWSTVGNVHKVRVLETLSGQAPPQEITVAIGAGQCLNKGQAYYLFLVAAGQKPDSPFVDDPNVQQWPADYGFSAHGPANAVLVSGGMVFPQDRIGDPPQFEGAAESEFRSALESAIDEQTS